jgi:ABC-type lipoprotein export system ATPase subunit
MQQAMNQPPSVVEARGITRVFQAKSGPVQALRGIDLRIVPGEMVALRGRSGSGKTTLLNILVGLDDPTEGSLSVLGHSLRGMSEAARAHLRREGIGMLFQNAHLFPALTAQENVEIPLRLAKMDPTERNRRASEALDLVGLAARSRHRGTELSGGEQQRVALARALVHAPRFVVADEPTGNLDSMTGRTVVELLRTIAHQAGIAFLVATHDMTVVEAADRVVGINDGRLG